MKSKLRTIAGALLLAAIGFPFVSAPAAYAQPLEIRNPDLLDTQVLDYNGPVILVICKDANECAATEQALKSAETDPDFIKAASAAAKQKSTTLKFSWSLAANLPELSREWDAGDKAVCLKDSSKKESECNDLAYPVFIVKNGPNAQAPGVEEMQRGNLDSKAIVGMALHAFDNLGVDLNK